MDNLFWGFGHTQPFPRLRLPHHFPTPTLSQQAPQERSLLLSPHRPGSSHDTVSFMLLLLRTLIVNSLKQKLMVSLFDYCLLLIH